MDFHVFKWYYYLFYRIIKKFAYLYFHQPSAAQWHPFFCKVIKRASHTGRPRLLGDAINLLGRQAQPAGRTVLFQVG